MSSVLIIISVGNIKILSWNMQIVIKKVLRQYPKIHF